MFNLKYILTGGAIFIATLILLSAPYRSELKLALEDKLAPFGFNKKKDE